MELVSDLMTREVVTVDRNEDLSVPDRIMTLGRIRHLPVLDDGRLCGIVSQRDLMLNALSRALGFGSHARDKTLASLPVKEAMTTEVITVSPNTPIAEAAKLMVNHKIGCLPVVEKGELVGILTESDFVARYIRSKSAK